MKTYMTAEQFEEYAEKMNQKADRIMRKAHVAGMKLVSEAYNALNDDQKKRVQVRYEAKLRREAEEMRKAITQLDPKIVLPGTFRTQ